MMASAVAADAGERNAAVAAAEVGDGMVVCVGAGAVAGTVEKH